MSGSPRCAQGPGTWEIPVFDLPWSARLNPAHSLAGQRSGDWASRFGLIASEADGRRLRRGQYGLLCGYFYPEAALEDLVLATDWTTWEFALDDMCAGWQLACDWPAVHSAVSRLAAFLPADETQAVPAAASPIESALVNLRERTMARMTPSWRRRFFGSLRRFAAGYGWETRNLSLHLVPDLTDHIVTRRDTSGALPLAGLIELVTGFEIPPGLIRTRAISAGVTAAVDTIMDVNDICSFDKERAAGDVHNNVYIFQQLMGCSRADAVGFVGAMAQSRARLLQQVIGDEIPMMLDAHGAGPQIRAGVATWAGLLALWLPGNLEWHRATGRYRDAGPRPQGDGATHVLRAL